MNLMLMNPAHRATDVLVGRETKTRAGRCDPALRACMDLDFWVPVTALRRGNTGGTSELLADYRTRITCEWSRLRQDWLRVWDMLRTAGLVLSPQNFSRGYDRNALCCSTIVYQAGNNADTRGFVAKMWRYDPTFAAPNPIVQIRTLSVVASLFPEQSHKTLRLRLNAAWTWFRG